MEELYVAYLNSIKKYITYNNNNLYNHSYLDKYSSHGYNIQNYIYIDLKNSSKNHNNFNTKLTTYFEKYLINNNLQKKDFQLSKDLFKNVLEFVKKEEGTDTLCGFDLDSNKFLSSEEEIIKYQLELLHNNKIIPNNLYNELSVIVNNTKFNEKFNFLSFLPTKTFVKYDDITNITPNFSIDDLTDILDNIKEKRNNLNKVLKVISLHNKLFSFNELYLSFSSKYIYNDKDTYTIKIIKPTILEKTFKIKYNSDVYKNSAISKAYDHFKLDDSFTELKKSLKTKKEDSITTDDNYVIYINNGKTEGFLNKRGYVSDISTAVLYTDEKSAERSARSNGYSKIATVIKVSLTLKNIGDLNNAEKGNTLSSMFARQEKNDLEKLLNNEKFKDMEKQLEKHLEYFKANGITEFLPKEVQEVKKSRRI